MKGKEVTIVMYHYVRELQHSRYPSIKGLDNKLFKDQVLYFKKHYQFVSVEDLVDAYNQDVDLPENAILLTFDDGYKDHFDFVFPFLNEQQIQGAFYPPVKTVKEHCVLDVNKIHFILASAPNIDVIIEAMEDALVVLRKNHDLRPVDHYRQKLSSAGRYDPPKVMYVKRMLQKELDHKLRKKIIDQLFERFVGMSEEAFSRELYMNEDQLKCMLRHGMHIGSHGYDHFWLTSLSDEAQKNEIEKSVTFLNELGCAPAYRSICYPYGDFNEKTIEIAEANEFKMGVTVETRIANISTDHALLLPRLNTNDFPKNRNGYQN